MDVNEEKTMPRPEDRLIDRHDDRKYASEGETANVDDLRREMKRESNDAVGVPGAPVMTRSMGRGLLIGSIVGGALGAILFAPLGLIPVAGLDLGWRLFIAAGCGAVGGGTAGAHYFGGRLPEVEGEMVGPDGRPTIASSERNRPDRGGLV